MLYDISRTIDTQTSVWPQTPSFSWSYLMQLSQGNSVNLTQMTLTPHTATHSDAFYHYEPTGEHPAHMPLDAFIGPARVIEIEHDNAPIMPADIAERAQGAQRLLFRSHFSKLADNQWSNEFPYLSVELIAWCAEQGIRLIGLDSPSVDAFDSTTLPCHHALYQHRIVNLELLQLRDVPEGDYELIALPLKLDHLCGSPVRAVLRTLGA